MMFYIPKIGDYLIIMTDDEVKDFVSLNLVIILDLKKKNCVLNSIRNKILEKLLNCFIFF